MCVVLDVGVPAVLLQLLGQALARLVGGLLLEVQSQFFHDLAEFLILQIDVVGGHGWCVARALTLLNRRNVCVCVKSTAKRER